jgi:pyocin large subunit-like protein
MLENKMRLFLVTIFTLMLVACASTPEPTAGTETHYDSAGNVIRVGDPQFDEFGVYDRCSDGAGGTITGF